MDDIPDRGETQSTGEIEDRRLITELLVNWVVWRDAGDWKPSAASGTQTGA